MTLNLALNDFESSLPQEPLLAEQVNLTLYGIISPTIGFLSWSSLKQLDYYWTYLPTIIY